MKNLLNLGRQNKSRPHNSTYPKGGVLCFKDSFVVNQTFVFQIKFCGKIPALRVAANRYTQGVEPTENWFTFDKNGGNIDKLYSSRLQSRKKKI